MSYLLISCQLTGYFSDGNPCCRMQLVELIKTQDKPRKRRFGVCIGVLIHGELLDFVSYSGDASAQQLDEFAIVSSFLTIPGCRKPAAWSSS